MGDSQEMKALTRIKALVDPGSFVELGGNVCGRNTDLTLKELFESSDGVVTGYGLVNGRLVFLYSQDPDVLHGSLGEMHCKKIVSIYAQAVKMGAPVIGLIDCSGLRLQEGVDALNGLGEIIDAAREASGIVPEFTVIYGNCGGGLSLIPALSDFNFMVEEKGRLFVNSPNTIDNNYTEKLDTASADFQGLYSGLIDDVVAENELASVISELLELIPANNTEGSVMSDCQDDLNRLIPTIDAGNYDAKALLANISDNCIFAEVKKHYAEDMVTGFISLNGITVGAFAGNSEDGRLSVDALLKATDFVRFCDAYEIPLLCIPDYIGFKADLTSEKSLARAMSSFATAISEADVAKVTLIPRQAYGTPFALFNSKALGADFVYSFANAKMGIIPGKEASKILNQVDEVSITEADYDAKYNGNDAFSRRGAIDRVINSEDTRKYLVSAFDLLVTKYSVVQDKKHPLR